MMRRYYIPIVMGPLGNNQIALRRKLAGENNGRKEVTISIS